MTRPAAPTPATGRADTPRRWVAVCRYDRLLPERGVCALVDGAQVALFRTWDDALYAVGNYDPVGGAYVLSRGIVGTRGGAPVVASPLYKTTFDLRTGACLDDPEVAVPVYPVRRGGAEGAVVEIGAAGAHEESP